MEQARAATAGANGAQWPSLHAVGGYTHYMDNQRVIPARSNGEPGAFSDNLLSGDLVLSLPLFTGGQITNRIKAAELTAKAAVHRLGRTREELIYNVSSLYYSILGQQRVVESLEFSKKVLEEDVVRIKNLIEVQKAVKVDLLRIEVRLASIQQRMVQERNTLAIEKRVLANLLGIETGPADEITLSGKLPTDIVQASLNDDLSIAYRQRTDFRSAQADADSQARKLAGAKGARWPQVYGRASYGGRYGIDSDRPAGVREAEDVATAGVMIDIPIFEGGQIAARIQEERMRLQAAKEKVRKLQLQIRLDIETAVLNINSSQERVQATSKSIEQAQESLEIEQMKYEQGKGAIVDVLDSQSALLEAQTNYFRALADHQTARAQLRLARGEHP